jgi:hypothetical protein
MLKSILGIMIIFVVAPAQKRSIVDRSAPIAPTNCAYNSMIVDSVRSKLLSSDSKNDYLIAIARLGNGERTSELNRRRLYTVRQYLIARGVPSDRLIVAEGERIKGYGRVELYSRGELVENLVGERCADLPVQNCEEDFYDPALYLPRKGKRRWCR